MNIHRLFAVGIAFMFVFFTTSCNDGETDGRQFSRDLRGTWVSNNLEDFYIGTLVIDYNSITIMGYGEIQTPVNGNDERRPFKGFTKGTALAGYAKDGYIFINDRGSWQAEIPFLRYDTNRGQDKFLLFTFGDREEILQRE